MPLEFHPIVIVGAGPGGAAASIQLSKHGQNHLIIDKNDFPRPKTCGDGLILKVLPALKSLDPTILDSLLLSPDFVHAWGADFLVNESNIFHVDVSPHTLPYAPILFGKRFHFDQLLADRISGPFAQFQKQTALVKLSRFGKQIHMTVEGPDGKQREIKANLVLGCDGAQSKVSCLVSPRTEPKQSADAVFLRAYFSLTKPLPTAQIRIVYEKRTPIFFYLFPLVNNEVNVSIGCPQRDLRDIDLKQVAETLIQSDPRVSPIFVGARLAEGWKAWRIPLRSGSKPVVSDNIILAGDAASLANPFYKEGVGTSICSGILAAQTALMAIKKNDFSKRTLIPYQQSLRREFSPLLRISRVAHFLTRSPRLFDLVSRLLKAHILHRIYRLIFRSTYPDLKLE